MHFMPPLIHYISNQDVGHQQSSGGSQGQAQPGGRGQTRSSVTQVAAAAHLVHGVNGGVAVAGGEVHLFGLVALSHR